MSVASPASIVRHPALSLNLQACGSDGIGKLRQDHGCEPLRVAVAAFRLVCETLGEQRPHRIKGTQIHPSQRQACGVTGIVGDGQRIDSIRAGWHGILVLWVAMSLLTVPTRASRAARQWRKRRVSHGLTAKALRMRAQEFMRAIFSREKRYFPEERQATRNQMPSNGLWVRIPCPPL